MSANSAENQSGGGHAGACGNEHMLDFVNLVDRCTAQLPHALGDSVHPVDVGLAELSAVGVDRQTPADLDRPIGDEVLGLPLAAKPNSSNWINVNGVEWS
jgi:hypothetical protein